MPRAWHDIYDNVARHDCCSVGRAKGMSHRVTWFEFQR